jgi:hypothetical protein
MNGRLQSNIVERDDELDLEGLWKVLIKYKRFIAAFVISITLIAVFYVVNLPTEYKVTVLMLPSNDATGSKGGASYSGISNLASSIGLSIGGSNTGALGDRALAKLKTKHFLGEYIQENFFKPILFGGKWNKKEGRWIGEEPSNQEASELLLSMLTIFSDPNDKSGMTSLILKWKDTGNLTKMKNIVNGLVSHINIKAAQSTKLEAKNRIIFLEKELKNTSVLEFKMMLYSLMEHQMQKVMMADSKEDFVFTMIDPATDPLHPEDNHKTLIIVISIFFGFFLSIFFSVLHESYKNHK